MEATKQFEKQIYLHQQTAIALWQSTPPLSIDGGFEQAARFYHALQMRAKETFETQVLSLAQKAYEEEKDTKKRFSFLRYVGTHSIDIVEKAEGVLSVKRTICIKRGGKVLAKSDFAEVWGEGSILLAPTCFCTRKDLRKAAKAHGISKRALLKADFYVKEQKAHFLLGESIAIVPTVKKGALLLAIPYKKRKSGKNPL